MFLGEFGQDTLREVKLDSQGKILKINQLLNCGAVQSNRTQPFECDNPNDMQFGADGAFYLLTYGDGFFAANAGRGHVQVGVRQGPARARTPCSTPTRRTARRR